MKILKKINLQELSDKNMDQLMGGMTITPFSNKNDASGCVCKNSTDGFIWCNNNHNKADSCYCLGNDNNVNKETGCKCG